MGCGIARTPEMTKTEAKRLAGEQDFDCKELGPKHWKAVCRKAGRCVCTDNIIIPEQTFFICGASIEQCSRCAHVADYLCDYPMGKRKTCDAPLCEDCAIKPGPLAHPLDDITARREPAAAKKRKKTVALIEDTHFCPAHWALSQEQKS